MKLYEYRILFMPNVDEKKEMLEKPKILATGETFAKDQKEIDMRCARMIPEEFLERLDEIVIATRPF